MQLICLGLATAITFLALVTHVTIGTAQNASPILDNSSLPEAPRHTLAFSWRANSVLMLFMTAAFGLGFANGVGELVLFNALLATALALTSGFVAIKSGLNPLRFPPLPLFALIAALGLSSYFL